MIIPRLRFFSSLEQREFGNRENKLKRRQWEMNQGLDIAQRNKEWNMLDNSSKAVFDYSPEVQQQSIKSSTVAQRGTELRNAQDSLVTSFRGDSALRRDIHESNRGVKNNTRPKDRFEIGEDKLTLRGNSRSFGGSTYLTQEEYKQRLKGKYGEKLKARKEGIANGTISTQSKPQKGFISLKTLPNSPMRTENLTPVADVKPETPKPSGRTPKVEEIKVETPKPTPPATPTPPKPSSSSVGKTGKSLFQGKGKMLALGTAGLKLVLGL